MRNVHFPNNKAAKASLDIEIGGVELKDCILKHGSQGFWIDAPSKECTPYVNKKGVTVKWKPTVYIPKNIQDQLVGIASQAYDPNGEGNYVDNRDMSTTHLSETQAEVETSFAGVPLNPNG